MGQERERLQGGVLVAPQAIQRLLSEVAAGEQRLDYWDEHIQGHHVAVHASAEETTGRGAAPGAGGGRPGVCITVEGLLAQDLEEPCGCETGVEHVKVL